MSSAVAPPRPRPSARPTRSLAPAQAAERSLERRVMLAWGLLLLNVLTWEPDTTILHIPSTLGQAITQGSLSASLLVILTVNRRLIIRPNVFLCLPSLLVIEAVLTCLQAQYLKGTAYRTFRLAEFVAVLWLFTPFWGRRDLLLVRCHLKAMTIVLVTVAIGKVIAPGRANDYGRLQGIIWPAPPTQVAHYAAITLGLVAVLWFCNHKRSKPALITIVGAGVILILTHTRTALVGMLAGLLVAGLSLIVTETRVRRMFAAAGAVAAIAVLAFSGPITTWLARGEGTTQITNLSGRTNFWGPVLAYPRNKFEEIFGFGLSNAQFGGLPIDSNWIASYLEQGLFGIVICATMLLFLFVTAFFQPRGVQRALALFLVTYCLVASFTEVGFTDASTYLLDMTVAASLLVPAVVSRRQPRERVEFNGLREP